MRELEERFPEELVIIGVHSGKFIAERVTANIQEAVLRLGVRHPVVNDRQFRIWRSYAVNAWPTLTLIDPEGRVVGQQAGELPANDLARAIERVIRDAEARGTLDRTPIVQHPDAEPSIGRRLRYPGKVLADGVTRRLFIADTGHHRVLVVRLDDDGLSGELDAGVGVGRPGFTDGDFGQVSFRDPHGLALIDDILYVADTGNHAVRAIHLGERHVETVVGDGLQARHLNQAGRGVDVRLNSPWDLLFHGGVLYIAMAGSHQVWHLDPSTTEARPWAGSGAEALHDDNREMAALAQPSGITTDGEHLFIADAESSAIRSIDLDPGGAVDTIVGTGLFDFGDRDGVGEAVRLQHPLGVAWSEGLLYVADTYNGKIKALDPTSRKVHTVVGPEGGLWEPGGLAVSDGRIYIADTNHHRIAVAGSNAMGVEEIAIRGI